MKVRKTLKEINYIKLIAVVVIGLIVMQVINNPNAIDNSFGIDIDWDKVGDDLNKEIGNISTSTPNADIEIKKYEETILKIPDSSTKEVVIINNNIPLFTDEEIEYAKLNGAFEDYSELDSLGRCGPAIAYISQELMPTEERGSISEVKPSGWHLYNTKNKWDIVLPSGNFYLLQRAHLIAYCLTSENANPKNLITGTDQLNQAMIEYEVKVAKYVEDTGNKVLYRSTPVFEGDNLLAKGVLLEAQTLDNNDICFCVFIYNVQDGFEFNYKNGEAKYSAK